LRSSGNGMSDGIYMRLMGRICRRTLWLSGEQAALAHYPGLRWFCPQRRKIPRACLYGDAARPGSVFDSKTCSGRTRKRCSRFGYFRLESTQHSQGGFGRYLYCLGQHGGKALGDSQIEKRTILRLIDLRSFPLVRETSRSVRKPTVVIVQ